MERRAFIALLGGAAATWPLMARAQQPAMPAVGILASVSPGPYGRFIEAIKQGLREVGYVEGRNVAIEWNVISLGAPVLDQSLTQLLRMQDRSMAGVRPCVKDRTLASYLANHRGLHGAPQCFWACTA